MTLSLQTLINLSTPRLSAVADRPAHEVRMLLAHVCERTPEWVFAHPEAVLTLQQEQAFEAMVARRVRGEPLAKIVGRKGFWKDVFHTTQHTLDPRPETELIIEAALSHCSPPPERILELGVGTGCLILSLLREFSTAQGVAVDLSWEALQVAQANAGDLGLLERIKFHQGQWFDGVKGPFDLIVSNPPYIPSPHMAHLSTTVLNYDPHLALEGGSDGLDPYRYFADHHIDRLLSPGGHLIMEMGIDQADDVVALMQKTGLTHLETRPDLQGIPRVVVLESGI
jgi:release factor glutamine methyltransferase